MDIRRLAVFEDEHVNDLYPLTLTQAAFDLRCGASTLGERLTRYYPELPAAFLCRPELAAAVQERDPARSCNPVLDTGVLYLNARAYPACDLARQVAVEGDERVFLNAGRLVAARLSRETVRRIHQTPSIEMLADLPAQEIEVAWVDFAWDLTRLNGAAICDDFRLLGHADECQGRVFGGSHLLNPAAFHAAEGVEIQPGCVLDARNGPILLAENVTLMAHAFIQGPCAIAADTVIKSGARLYGPVSIGPCCKVGGEVTRSILMGYTNKNHDGFLGDSYLGEWVNLGADTNTSNLKNTLSPLNVTIRERIVETGHVFLGAFLGDHVRAGINTMFNSGTVVGAACNVYGGGFPPKAIPSFSWGGSEGFAEYDFAKFCAVAERVMERRNRPFGPGERHLYECVFTESSTERRRFLEGPSA